MCEVAIACRLLRVAVHRPQDFDRHRLHAVAHRLVHRAEAAAAQLPVCSVGALDDRDFCGSRCGAQRGAASAPTVLLPLADGRWQARRRPHPRPSHIGAPARGAPSGRICQSSSSAAHSCSLKSGASPPLPAWRPGSELPVEGNRGGCEPAECSELGGCWEALLGGPSPASATASRREPGGSSVVLPECSRPEPPACCRWAGGRGRRSSGASLFEQRRQLSELAGPQRSSLAACCCCCMLQQQATPLQQQQQQQQASKASTDTPASRHWQGPAPCCPLAPCLHQTPCLLRACAGASPGSRQLPARRRRRPPRAPPPLQSGNCCRRCCCCCCCLRLMPGWQRPACRCRRRTAARRSALAPRSRCARWPSRPGTLKRTRPPAPRCTCRCCRAAPSRAAARPAAPSCPGCSR